LLAPSAPNLPAQTDFPPLRTILISLSSQGLRWPLFDTLATILRPTVLALLPAASLSLLFFSSTLLTEGISKEKYPEAYGAYQKRVAMFSPIGTLCKAVKLRLLGREEENKKIEELVWGNPEGKSKSE